MELGNPEGGALLPIRSIPGIPRQEKKLFFTSSSRREEFLLA